MKKFLTISMLMVVLVACNQNNSSSLPDDKEAKEMLQGVWVDEESGDVSFRVSGDTLYFADATSMPTYFRASTRIRFIWLRAHRIVSLNELSTSSGLIIRMVIC